MTTSDQRFSQALNAWLEQHPDLTKDVSEAVLDGRLCVIKIKKPSLLSRLSDGVRYLRASFISLLCWWGFNERPSPSVLLRNSVEDETARLLTLHAHRYPVPEVLHHGPGLLVLEFVGENLPTIIRESSPEQRLIWMDRAAQDLAAFHRAGFVHGGAQLRNLMVQGDQITRIDFEENIGEALSTPLGQAYDVYQMMSSMAGLRGDQFSEQERRLLCDRLLGTYLAANPDPRVKALLIRLGQLFAGMLRYTRWLLHWIPGRDVRGFLYVSDALRV